MAITTFDDQRSDSRPGSRFSYLQVLWVERGAIACLLAAGILFSVYYVTFKHAVPTLFSDAYEYAQVARNIAGGRGLVTNTATVLEWSMLGSGGPPLPYFFHDPGNPLLLALFFKIFGSSDRIIGLMSGLFYVLAAPATFLLASRLFDRRVGLLAGLLVVISPELIVYGVTGYSEVPYAFFLTLLLLLLYALRAPWTQLLSGVLFGWLAVLRSNSLPFLPWLLIFIAWNALDSDGANPTSRSRREQIKTVGMPTGLFLLGFILFFIPFALRNYIWIHNPLYNINSVYNLIWYTSAIPGKSSSVFSMPGLSIDPVRFILDHPDQLVNKAQYQLSRTVPQLLMGGTDFNGNWTDAIYIFLFLASILIPRPKESNRQKRFRWLVYALILTAFVFGALYNIRWRHLFGFIPVVSIYIAELLRRAIEQGRETGTAQGSHRWFSYSTIAPLGIVLILFLLGLGPVRDNIAPSHTMFLYTYYRELGHFVAENTPDSAVIVTFGNTEVLQTQNGLAWTAGRFFIQYHKQTYPTIATMPLKSSLYLLKIPDDPQADRSIGTNPPFSGLSPVANWNDKKGNIKAVLFKKQ